MLTARVHTGRSRVTIEADQDGLMTIACACAELIDGHHPAAVTLARSRYTPDRDLRPGVELMMITPADTLEPGD